MDQHPAYSITDWFVTPRPNPAAEIRLFLFPYAGGGPAVFNKWALEFPASIEVWIAHYPGRGARYQEAPVKEIRTLAERLSQAIRPFLDKPFAFFGHSLGGLLAFELARNLRSNHLPQPQLLFVSAYGAPHLPDPHPPTHGLPDADFIKSLQQLNGIPVEVLKHSELMKLLLPVLRADFEAFESYVYVADEAPLHCPIVAFGGLDDSRVSRERIEGWALHTDSSFKVQYIPGDHFFISQAKEEVIASITTELVTTHAKNETL